MESLVWVERASSSSSYNNNNRQEQISAFQDLEDLQFLSIQGCDNQGRRIIRIVGKFLPAPVIDNSRLKDYILHKVSRELQSEQQFCIVYFHSTVNRKDNSPGLFTIRWLYETLPQEFRQNIQAIYFVHPGLLSRTILGTLGRFFLSEGVYYKLCYISRIEFLWDHIKKGQVEIPEFVSAHDRELEHRPLMDYWVDSDPLNTYTGSSSRKGVAWNP